MSSSSRAPHEQAQRSLPPQMMFSAPAAGSSLNQSCATWPSDSRSAIPHSTHRCAPSAQMTRRLAAAGRAFDAALEDRSLQADLVVADMPPERPAMAALVRLSSELRRVHLIHGRSEAGRAQGGTARRPYSQREPADAAAACDDVLMAGSPEPRSVCVVDAMDHRALRLAARHTSWPSLARRRHTGPIAREEARVERDRQRGRGIGWHEGVRSR